MGDISGQPWLLLGQRGGLPPSLDLKFLAAPLDPRITFTRASTATYFDSSGTMQTATANTPRWDYDPVTHVLNGLLIEEARTNLLLNSATLGTQSVTTTAAATTLSFYGTGTVTLSGTSTAGPLTGTGASNRVSLTFTPTAGTLTCTVTGTVSNAQIEVGAFATSYIPTTGATVLRTVEQCRVTSIGSAPWFNAASGTLAYDYASARTSVVGGMSDGTTANRIIFSHLSGNVTAVAATIAKTLAPLPVLAYPSRNRTVMNYQPSRTAACLNGGAVVSDATLAARAVPVVINIICRLFGMGT